MFAGSGPSTDTAGNPCGLGRAPCPRACWLTSNSIPITEEEGTKWETMTRTPMVMTVPVY